MKRFFIILAFIAVSLNAFGDAESNNFVKKVIGRYQAFRGLSYDIKVMTQFFNEEETTLYTVLGKVKISRKGEASVGIGRKKLPEKILTCDAEKMWIWDRASYTYTLEELTSDDPKQILADVDLKVFNLWQSYEGIDFALCFFANPKRVSNELKNPRFAGEDTIDGVPMTLVQFTQAVEQDKVKTITTETFYVQEPDMLIKRVVFDVSTEEKGKRKKMLTTVVNYSLIDTEGEFRLSDFQWIPPKGAKKVEPKTKESNQANPPE